VAGNRMDEDIVRYIKRKHNLLLGERMAEDIKMTVGSASTLETELTMWIKGRDLVEGMPRTLMISDREIREALSEAVSHIVEAVCSWCWSRRRPSSLRIWWARGLCSRGAARS
jgi:rod shape-determining protein MreB and related proteins